MIVDIIPEKYTFSELIDIQEALAEHLKKHVDITTFKAAFQRKHMSHILDEAVDV